MTHELPFLLDYEYLPTEPKETPEVHFRHIPKSCVLAAYINLKRWHSRVVYTAVAQHRKGITK